MSGFSREQIEQADRLDLAGYLESRGYRLVPKGSQYRLAEHDSLYIKGNQWYWFSQKKGGKTISFLTQYEGRTFEEAMNELLGPGRTLTRTVPAVPKPESQKKLLLPEQAHDNEAVYAYLKKRGINPWIIKECIEKGILYQTEMYWKGSEEGAYEKEACAPSAVFVGKDKDGTARYACMRSTVGKGKYDAAGSDKSYAFSLPVCDCPKSVWVFESAIDLLSHATICRLRKSNYPVDRISLGGLSPNALYRYIKEHPTVRTVHLGLDRDKAGREAEQSIRRELGIGYTVVLHFPEYGKDYNEDLIRRRELYQEQQKTEKGEKAACI